MSFNFPYRLNKNSTAEEVAAVLTRLKDYLERGVDDSNFADSSKGNGLDFVEDDYNLVAFVGLDGGDSHGTAAEPFLRVQSPSTNMIHMASNTWFEGSGSSASDTFTVESTAPTNTYSTAINSSTVDDNTFYPITTTEPPGDAFNGTLDIKDTTNSVLHRVAILTFVRIKLEGSI